MAAELLVGGGSTRRDNCCWCASCWARRRCGASPAIHLRRPVAEREAVGAGVRWGRRPVAEKGAAQRDRLGTTLPESVLERWRAQSPRRSRVRGRHRGKLSTPLGTPRIAAPVRSRARSLLPARSPPAYPPMVGIPSSTPALDGLLATASQNASQIGNDNSTPISTLKSWKILWAF
jgi:hypothetical protein